LALLHILIPGVIALLHRLAQ